MWNFSFCFDPDGFEAVYCAELALYFRPSLGFYNDGEIVPITDYLLIENAKAAAEFYEIA